MQSPHQQKTIVSPYPSEQRILIMGGLLGLGLLLVLFAGPLSDWLSWMPMGPNSYSFNSDKAQNAALTLRILGCLFFLGGLAERIALEIASLRDSTPAIEK